MPEQILIVLVLLLMLIFPLLTFFIKPDGRYHCHEPGCGKSFNTMDEILRHLRDNHNYDSSSIDQIKSEINSLRG